MGETIEVIRNGAQPSAKGQEDYNSWFQFSRNFSRLFGLMLGGILVETLEGR
ncbi:hypothetical protein [Geobacillus proteiniphilus]|uniref:hypothetical protein n=1 Tax=Geobacillus proteiniphilus TaxID=860353 RepID=UPI000B005D7E|nr:hypothetical protein [Geobacillus proteiniphilus]